MLDVRGFAVLCAVAIIGCERFVATDGREFTSTSSTTANPLREALVASGANDLECAAREVAVFTQRRGANESFAVVEGCGKRATYFIASGGHLKLVGMLATP